MAGIWDVTPIIVVTMFVIGLAGVIVYERARIKNARIQQSDD